MKTKSGIEVANAMEDIFTSSGNKPDEIQSDKGKEFFNSHFKAMLSKYKINHYASNNTEIKASVVERVQRTLKTKLFKLFTHTNSYQYLDDLQDVISSYNNSIHTAHKMRPNSVNETNQEEIWQYMYGKDHPNDSLTKYKFKLNDKVRISKYSTIFKKGYLPSWSEEIFKISKVHQTTPPVYSLMDDASDELEGTWYEPEMQKVEVKNNTYKIESIISQRKINGRTEYLVRWAGYPPSFDTYVPKNQLLLSYNN